MTTSQFLFSAWTLNPVVLFASAAAVTWYLSFFRFDRRIGWFLAGILVLLFTLLSPLNALANGYLFSAHMAQHILLLLIVPALLLLGFPRWPWPKTRLRILGHPLAGWISGVGAMWFWHIPAVCNAAVYSRLIHAMQTISLLALGTLFWRQVIFPPEDNGLSPMGSIVYLFSACVACSLLGIIITLSPVSVCSIYTMPPAIRTMPPAIYTTPPTDHLEMARFIQTNWRITPARDQQIGGLLMWVPMCLVYLSAIFAQMVRWFGVTENVIKEQKIT